MAPRWRFQRDRGGGTAVSTGSKLEGMSAPVTARGYESSVRRSNTDSMIAGAECVSRGGHMLFCKTLSIFILAEGVVMNSPSWLEVLPAIVSLVAAFAGCWAAWAASRSAKAAENIIEAQTGPFVNVYIAPRADEPDMAVWIIENSGFSTARNVKFYFEGDKAYGILGKTMNENSNFPEKHPFNIGIKTLPPKCAQMYNIDIWPNIESRCFTVKWSYMSDTGKVYKSEFTWDDFKASGMTIPTPPLTRIARSIEKIAGRML